MEILGWILLVAGMIALLVSYVWIVVIAFRDHIGHGIGCLICNCYSLIYCVTNWEHCATPFCIQIVGGVAFYGGAAMAGVDLNS